MSRRIDHVVPASAVGHAYDADAAGASGVAIRGETDTGLVRQGDDLESLRTAKF
jgi:hypothetical protein